MDRSGAEIRSAVRRHARRRFRRQALRLALNLAAPAALLLGLAAAVLLSQRPEPSRPLAITAILLCTWGILIPVLVLLFRPVRVQAEAKRLDDGLSLKDRLTSALAFLDLPSRTAFEEASIADATRHLDAVGAHAEARRSLRGPILRWATAALVGFLCVGASLLFSPDRREPGDNELARTERRGENASSSTAADSTGRTNEETPVSDEDLVEVEDTTLVEEAPESAFNEADLAAMQALGAGETGEADRLLAQAAYLNESDLSDSGADRGARTSGEDVMTMKEPDMDMIREMVKEAQERKKKGDDSGDGDDINLEVLIKSQSASSGKRSGDEQSGSKSSGGGGGPSQDTRIKPKRVDVARKVEFRIASMRSLTPPGETDAKRIALSEAIMRTSGVPQPPLAKERTVTPPEVPDASRPLLAQGVPARLRAYVSRYYEGLKDLSETP